MDIIHLIAYHHCTRSTIVERKPIKWVVVVSSPTLHSNIVGTHGFGAMVSIITDQSCVGGIKYSSVAAS